MTLEELDRVGPELEMRCNAAIEERAPSWSRYAIDQMVVSTIAEIAPYWDWSIRYVVNGVPQIVLKQYRGAIEQ